MLVAAHPASAQGGEAILIGAGQCLGDLSALCRSYECGGIEM